jgi:hypothetical protein
MLSKKHKSNAPIAYDDGDHKLVYYLDNKKGDGVEHMVAKGKFIPWFYKDTVMYISGRRGSGKSTYCNDYMQAFSQTSDGPIYYITRFEYDPSVDLPDRGRWVNVKDIDQFRIDDLKGSLLVFDDINDAYLTKKQETAIAKLIQDVLENSRHFNISTLITSHMISNYKATRIILNECSGLVVYPEFSNQHQIKYALDKYFGLSKGQINQIYDLKGSRWVQIESVYPKYILTQHECYIYK